MEKIFYLLAGAVITWGLYFIQRRLERRKTSEIIDRNQKLLALKQGLEASSTTLEELRQFEGRLIGKAQAAVEIAGHYVSQAGEVARQGERSTLTQREMNDQAMAGFHATDHALERSVAHLRSQLSGDDLGAFEQVHQAWLAYRDRYARFIAQSYSGGSIQPLIHAVTLESITAAWKLELETQLGDDDADIELVPDGA
ncbi:lysozyme inhibitor LprI family protein [Lysobacter fragariae]